MINETKKSPLKTIAGSLPFYYGWIILLVVMIASIVAGVGQTYGISVFNPSIMDSLGMSHTLLSGTYMVGTLLAALPQPYLGSLIDRFGIRRTMSVVVVLLGASCLFFSFVNSLLTLLIGFFLLRFLAHGAFNLFTFSMPAMWFREKLGTATGIVNVGFPISVAVIPPFFLFLNNQVGWRTSYLRLGILVWVIMLPILIFIYRDNPREVGLEMDGSPPGKDITEQIEEQDKSAFTFEEARSSTAYRIMLINTGIWTMIFSAVLFNLLSILTSQGISENVAVTTYTTFAVASVIAQVSLGPLANRGPLQIMLSACMLTFAGGLFFLSRATTPWIAQAYAVLVGISNGLISLLIGTLYARYFGREHLGKLNGLSTTVQVASTSLGPFITGLIYDFTGSFQISLWIFIFILVAGGILALKAVPPKPKLSLSS